MDQFDKLIENGTIIEGTSLPRFKGDVAIKDGRIARIGKVDPKDATVTIDANRLLIERRFPSPTPDTIQTLLFMMRLLYKH